MTIKILQAVDMQALKDFISIPEVWENIHDADGLPKDFMPLNTPESVWLLCVIEEEIVGVIYLHHDNSYTLKLHPYILKEHRKESRNIMFKFYEWFLDSIPEQVIKLIVSIPTTHKKVINFARKIGFQLEGNNKKSYIWNDMVFDQLNFGLTRDEMRRLAA